MYCVPRRLTGGWQLRLADQNDNDCILKFLAEHTMRANVSVRFDRSPDFFAHAKARGDHSETWIAIKDGVVGALGALSVQTLYVGDCIERVAYLSDLRSRPSRHLAGRWRAVILTRLRQLQVRYAYASVMRGNRFEQRLLDPSQSSGAVQFHHFCGYSNVTVLLRKPRPITKSELTVRPAESSDLQALIEFIAVNTADQILAPGYNETLFRYRQQTWPAFGTESFFIAISPCGQIVGCVAVCDWRSMRTTVVDSLGRPLDLFRRSLNSLSRITGRPPIPGAGQGPLPEAYLTHLVVEDRNPTVFSRLLETCYRQYLASGEFGMLTLCLFDQDRLWVTMRDYWYARVELDLYALSLNAAKPLLKLDDTQVPGFEMALV